MHSTALRKRLESHHSLILCHGCRRKVPALYPDRGAQGTASFSFRALFEGDGWIVPLTSTAGWEPHREESARQVQLMLHGLGIRSHRLVQAQCKAGGWRLPYGGSVSPVRRAAGRRERSALQMSPRDLYSDRFRTPGRVVPLCDLRDDCGGKIGRLDRISQATSFLPEMNLACSRQRLAKIVGMV